MSSSQQSTSSIAQRVIERRMRLKSWSEFFFDLTEGETEEAYVFLVPTTDVETIEEFVAAAVYRVLEHLGFEYAGIVREIETLKIFACAGAFEKTNWYGIARSRVWHGHRAQYAQLEAELGNAWRIFEIEVGPPSVQALTIARTSTHYVSLYWYATG